VPKEALTERALPQGRALVEPEGADWVDDLVEGVACGYFHRPVITPTYMVHQTPALTPLKAAEYPVRMWFNENVLHQPDVAAR